MHTTEALSIKLHQEINGPPKFNALEKHGCPEITRQSKVLASILCRYVGLNKISIFFAAGSLAQNAGET